MKLTTEQLADEYVETEKLKRAALMEHAFCRFDFLSGYHAGRRSALPDKVLFDKQAYELKCLRSERDLINKSIVEIESHYLTKTVRFLQTFHNRLWWKWKEVCCAIKALIRTFFPRKDEWISDYRSDLYKTLQAHLEDIKKE